jgi:hypothetical protein
MFSIMAPLKPPVNFKFHFFSSTPSDPNDFSFSTTDQAFIELLEPTLFPSLLPMVDGSPILVVYFVARS